METSKETSETASDAVIERRRPRDPDSARFLRDLGTPEELIGPVASYEECRRSYAEMRAFFARA